MIAQFYQQGGKSTGQNLGKEGNESNSYKRMSKQRKNENNKDLKVKKTHNFQVKNYR